MADRDSIGAPERQPADVLPALFHLEQGVLAFAAHLDQQHAALAALFTAYCIPEPSLATAAEMHRENLQHLHALRLRLQGLRHQLSRVLP